MEVLGMHNKNQEAKLVKGRKVVPFNPHVHGYIPILASF